VVAKVSGAKNLYIDDKNQTIFAGHVGLKVKHSWDWDLPDNVIIPGLFD
jgi:hypothetical protein